MNKTRDSIGTITKATYTTASGSYVKRKKLCEKNGRRDPDGAPSSQDFARPFFSGGFLWCHVRQTKRERDYSYSKVRVWRGQKLTVEWHTSRSVICPASPTGLSLPPLPESSLSSSDGSSFIIRNLNCKRHKRFTKTYNCEAINKTMDLWKGFQWKVRFFQELHALTTRLLHSKRWMKMYVKKRGTEVGQLLRTGDGNSKNYIRL